jgi:hypothetical protein
MSEYTKRPSILADVQRALWTEWDPIGLRASDPPGPPDEYDSYAGAVLNALNSGGGELALARVLAEIEVDRMGLPSRAQADLIADAKKIRLALAWKDAPEAT